MQLPQTAGVLVPLGIGAVVVVIIALVALIVRARRKRRRAADVTGTGVDPGVDSGVDPGVDAAAADAAEPTPSDWTGEALYAPPPQRSSGAHPVTVAEAMAGWKTEKSPVPAEQEMPPELDALLSPTTPIASPAAGARVPVQREPSTMGLAEAAALPLFGGPRGEGKPAPVTASADQPAPPAQPTPEPAPPVVADPAPATVPHPVIASATGSGAAAPPPAGPGSDAPKAVGPSPEMDSPGAERSPVDPGHGESGREASKTEEPRPEEPRPEEPRPEERRPEDSGIEDSSTEDPSTEDPSTEDPSTEDPSTEEPSTNQTHTGTIPAGPWARSPQPLHNFAAPQPPAGAEAPAPYAPPPPASAPRQDTRTPAAASGSSRTVAAAVAQALAVRAAASRPPTQENAGAQAPAAPQPSTPRGDARDRLLAVLLNDPVRAVGAAVELESCREQLDRLTHAVTFERGRLGEVLGKLAGAGLRPDQLARLAGMPLDEVRELLPATTVGQKGA